MESVMVRLVQVAVISACFCLGLAGLRVWRYGISITDSKVTIEHVQNWHERCQAGEDKK